MAMEQDVALAVQELEHSRGRRSGGFSGRRALALTGWTVLLFDKIDETTIATRGRGDAAVTLFQALDLRHGGRIPSGPS